MKKKKLIALNLCMALLLPFTESSVIMAEDTSLDTTNDGQGIKNVVTIDEEKSYFDSESHKYELYLIINENDDTDVKITIDEILGTLDMSHLNIMPGDKYTGTVYIQNNSGHTYVYKNDSLQINPVRTSSQMTSFIGYDRKPISVNDTGAISLTHSAILELFDKKASSSITADDMFKLYDKLREKNYTGDSALTDYMLHYYNEKYNSAYADWDSLVADKGASMTKDFAIAGNNGIFHMTFGKMKKYCNDHPELNDFVYMTGKPTSDNDTVSVQIKWPEEKLAILSFNFFYQDFLAVFFGEECETANPNEGAVFTRTRGVGDYLTDATLRKSANTYFTNQISQLSNDTNTSFDMAFTFDGPGIGNQYQNFTCDFDVNITLARIDTTYTIEHQYYTDNGEVEQLDGNYLEEKLNGTVWDTVSAKDHIKNIYNDNEYTCFTEDDSIVLGLDSEANKLVIKYIRHVKKPVDPEVPAVPEQPTIPETLITPEIPVTPEVPVSPEVPVTSDKTSTIDDADTATVDKTGNENSPETGDHTDLALYVSLFTMSILLFAILVVWKRKKALEKR